MTTKAKHLQNCLILFAILLISCQSLSEPTNLQYSEITTTELINLIEEPYTDQDYRTLYDAMEELEQRGAGAVEAAPALANAFIYSHRSIAGLASHALIAMGPSAEVVMPSMLEYLKNERSEVRWHAVFVLVAIGDISECAVPSLAKLLWDPDPMVRTSAAGALEMITGYDLVDETFEIDLEPPLGVVVDEPEGTATSKAREWWREEGQLLDWEQRTDCTQGE